MRRALQVGLLLVAGVASAQTDAALLRHELGVFPFTPQLNAKFTEHQGSALSYSLRVREHVALELFGQFNWRHQESGFSRELIANVSQQPNLAASSQVAWMLGAGTILSPASGAVLVGKKPWRLSGGLLAGAGLAETKITLWVNPIDGRQTHASTGLRPMGYTGLGLRAQANEQLSFRLELRRHFLSTNIKTVNGCTAADLTRADAAIRSGEENLAATPGISEACLPWLADLNRRADVPVALSNLMGTSSDILMTTHLHAGVSFLF